MSSTKCGSGGGWLEGVISALCLYSSDWFTHLLLTLWWIQALATFSHQRNCSGVSWTDRIPNKTVATNTKQKKNSTCLYTAHMVSSKCLEDPAVQFFFFETVMMFNHDLSKKYLPLPLSRSRMWSARSWHSDHCSSMLDPSDIFWFDMFCCIW